MSLELNLPTNLSDPTSASLMVVEFKDLDFKPERIYWMSEFVSGTTRGNHAHKTLRQAFFVMSGSVTLDLYRGETKTSVEMNKTSLILRVNPGIWRVIRNASKDCVMMVLADQPYDEDDYIRNWNDYLNWFDSGLKHG
jgi:dTDP-4-dehydrorhamnose 3,5-epimerase-like enzyme